MTKIFVDMKKDGSQDVRIVLDPEAVKPSEDGKLYWHVFVAKTFKQLEDGSFAPAVIAYCVGESPYESYKDIPEDRIPKHVNGFRDVSFRWRETLDHSPTEEEWEGYYSLS